mmetsp:Transcript_2397/g.4733  ORF Transcript_2397/g.4733 Transcript_2397/m.4733 type:complete len:377 (+) Transcript_2397:69-1199(+)
MTMLKIALALASLACVGTSRRVQASDWALQRSLDKDDEKLSKSVDVNSTLQPLAAEARLNLRVSPLKAALTAILEAGEPTAAFSTSGSGVRLPAETKTDARLVLGPRMQGNTFKTPKSTDTAAAEQAERAAASGLTPKEYEEATRQAAFDHLKSVGAHIGGDGDGSVQEAGFLKQLWNVDSIPALPENAVADPSRVLATVYEIGGPLTNILSTSVAKPLPLIPHVGIRVHGVEYFYSDHIEYRTVPVMKEMLGDRPQVTLDLGKTSLTPEEVQKVVDSLESDWTADDYHVFDKNCVHFADVLAKRVTKNELGMPRVLLQGVIDVSERMLDSLPEWRRQLGRRVMNEVTRLVVVSWGRASKDKKEKVADKLGVDRGE